MYYCYRSGGPGSNDNAAKLLKAQELKFHTKDTC